MMGVVFVFILFLFLKILYLFRLVLDEVPPVYQIKSFGDGSQKQGLIEINNSSSTSEIIVWFEEEMEWIISKLTSVPAKVDVMSIG